MHLNDLMFYPLCRPTPATQVRIRTHRMWARR